MRRANSVRASLAFIVATGSAGCRTTSGDGDATLLATQAAQNTDLSPVLAPEPLAAEIKALGTTKKLGPNLLRFIALYHP